MLETNRVFAASSVGPSRCPEGAVPVHYCPNDLQDRHRRTNANFRGGKLTDTFLRSITVSRLENRMFTWPSEHDIIRFPGSDDPLFWGAGALDVHFPLVYKHTTRWRWLRTSFLYGYGEEEDAENHLTPKGGQWCQFNFGKIN